MQVPLAIVHHANQYIITERYDNRPGLKAIVGSIADRTGLSWILELHRKYSIPANIHISGTLLEAIAWHQPAFLLEISKTYQEGLIELVGSSYGQNMMRFYSYDHNLNQLNEELALYQTHLDVNLAEVKTFWPPERLWDTERMAAVLQDMRLLNGGYWHVILDDRLLLAADGARSLRRSYDRDLYWHRELFRAYAIKNGHNLVALPIAYNLRQSIPPRGRVHWNNIHSQLRCLSTLDSSSQSEDLIAIYGDDMEKAAGVGWDSQGPSQFEAFLRWITENSWIRPVKLTDWASTRRIAGTRAIEAGTFLELANHFGAGEDYEKWYFDPHWNQCRAWYSWSEDRVKHLAAMSADPSLLALAEKHLLASTWETAWHTPPAGAHGDAATAGSPSPWIRAVASHSRHAALIAEAGFWMTHKDGGAHAYLYDIDGDEEQELILKNEKLFAVFSPRWGGRLVYLFCVDGERGTMCIGNPSDDWNLMEELNKYMLAPRNHPGALADVGFENDSYQPTISIADGPAVRAWLLNNQLNSAAYGLRKEVTLSAQDNALKVHYTLPQTLFSVSIEFGLSPDYLSLLRQGHRLLHPFDTAGARGRTAGTTTIWVKPENRGQIAWTKPEDEFGHGGSIRLLSLEGRFSLSIGIGRTVVEHSDEPGRRSTDVSFA